MPSLLIVLAALVGVCLAGSGSAMTWLRMRRSRSALRDEGIGSLYCAGTSSELGFSFSAPLALLWFEEGRCKLAVFDTNPTRTVELAADDVRLGWRGSQLREIRHAATGTRLWPRFNLVFPLDLSHIRSGKGNNEANQMVDRYERVIAKIGAGAKGVPYDMAMRGKQIDKLYELGVVPHVKVAAGPDGTIKNTLIETGVTVYRNGERVGTIDIAAIGGRAHARLDDGTDLHHIALEHTKVIRNTNQGNKAKRYRWFIECRLPDDPRLPQAVRHGMVRLRLDTTDEDRRRNINRAENLRAIHIDDDRWSIVGGQRSRAEALFSQVKRQWVNGRLNAVGVQRQTIRLLGITMAIRREAAINVERRTGTLLRT